jgi:glycosyltransferase involved in cell wall biosynthesis
MKILILISYINKTSIVNISVTLHRLMLDLGYDARIVELTDYISRSKPFSIELSRVVLNSDVVISVGAFPDIVTSLIRILAFRNPVRYISYLHCFQWPDLSHENSLHISLPYFLLWRISLYLKTTIACASFSILNSLPPVLSRKSCAVYNYIDFLGIQKALCTNPPELSQLREWCSSQSALGRKTLLAIGLFRKRKNFQYLIMQLQHNKGFSLAIIGDGPCKDEYMELAARLNVSSRLFINPYVSNPFIACNYVDAYVSPSLSEGFGLANVEAAYTGVSVVVPSLPVNLEILSSFKNVLFYNPSHANGLLNSLSLIPGGNHHRRLSPNSRYTLSSFKSSWNFLLQQHSLSFPGLHPSNNL